jgi:cardiolipin synthase
VLVVARDVIVVSGTLALHYLNGSVHVRPSWAGKIATVFQMIAIACVMLQLNFFQTTFAPVPVRCRLASST